MRKISGDEDGTFPVDYKVYTFGGKVHMVEICVGRNEHVKFLHVDPQYNRMDYSVTYYGDEYLPEKPKCFDKMLKYAEILSKPFCHVRIDFYVYKDQVILGEMTFTNNGGFDNYLKQEALDTMGICLYCRKNDMKRVLLMVPSLNMGGMERMLVNVANVLVKQGNEVTVLNLTGDDKAITERLDKRVNYQKMWFRLNFFSMRP